MHADPCSAVEQQLRFWVAANRNKRQTLTCATINSIYLPLPPPQPPQPLNHPPPPFSFLAVFAFDIGFFFLSFHSHSERKLRLKKINTAEKSLGKDGYSKQFKGNKPYPSIRTADSLSRRSSSMQKAYNSRALCSFITVSIRAE